MICPPCQTQLHEQCRYPHNCPCQHVPSEKVQITETRTPLQFFRDISLGHPEHGNSGVVVPPVVDELKRPSGGVTHSLQEPEEAKPLDMDALTRMFSAVAHLQA